MLTSAFSFTRLRAQFIKEVFSVLRDPRSRMVVFVPPILQLLIFAFAATLEVRNVDIAVYNQDAGRWSHELVQRLDSAKFIARVRHVDSQRHLHELIDRGEVIAALAIPVDFSRSIAAGDSGRAQVLVDGRRSNSGQITVAYLSTIAAEVGAEVVPTPSTNARGRASLVQPNLVYRWFIVPGLAGILALFSALLITSLSIARERELGTFDQLLVSPTSTPESSFPNHCRHSQLAPCWACS
ncbi:membrane protein [Pseudomonas veronii 1YdBTEX2]|uniref:Membrane protein n=1 Tax=Pseudomonas veronii 1YdBTEX2 TaxID=1295141 RepID=A0A1D3KA00_PSEVE|nr:membrane protein [Pseudomonas veronii 1YdBTEX2]